MTLFSDTFNSSASALVQFLIAFQCEHLLFLWPCWNSLSSSLPRFVLPTSWRVSVTYFEIISAIVAQMRIYFQLISAFRDSKSRSWAAFASASRWSGTKSVCPDLSPWNKISTLLILLNVLPRAWLQLWLRHPNPISIPMPELLATVDPLFVCLF